MCRALARAGSQGPSQLPGSPPFSVQRGKVGQSSVRACALFHPVCDTLRDTVL